MARTSRTTAAFSGAICGLSGIPGSSPQPHAQSRRVLCPHLLSQLFLFDLWLLGDVTVLSAVLRFAVIVPITIGLFAYIAGNHPIEKKEIAAILVALLANVCWCIILVSSSSPGVLTYFYAATSFQMAITIAAASPFRPALRASIFTFCPNYSAIWFLEDVTPSYVIQHLAVYMPTVIMTLLVSYQLEVEALTRQRPRGGSA